MKQKITIFSALLIAGFSVSSNAQDAAAEAPAEAKVTKMTFDDLEAGDVSDEVAFVIDGSFSVVAKDGGGKLLQAAASPLAESGALVGENLLGDVSVSAKVHATKRGRSFPRFGVGTHGMSGYRLRVVPSKRVVELVYREQTVAEAPFTWESDKWYHLKLTVSKTGEDSWKISGKAWQDGAEEPGEDSISHENTGLRGKGKSSVWGTPYSGTAISFDDLEIKGALAP